MKSLILNIISVTLAITSTAVSAPVESIFANQPDSSLTDTNDGVGVGMSTIKEEDFGKHFVDNQILDEAVIMSLKLRKGVILFFLDDIGLATEFIGNKIAQIEAIDLSERLAQ
ncbi:hypothetical protein LJB42_001482, partial [Komagataella kurtzmanii]